MPPNFEELYALTKIIYDKIKEEKVQEFYPSVQVLMLNKDNTCCYRKVYKNKCDECKKNINDFKLTNSDYFSICRNCDIEKTVDEFSIIRSNPLMHTIQCLECIKEKRKVNDDKNKEKRKVNNDKIKEKRKVNNDKIKKVNNNNYTCECGSILTKPSKSKHEKSKKHIDYVKQTQS